MKGDSNFLTFFICKNLISLSSLFVFLLSKPVFAGQLQNKSEILRQSNECLKDFQYEICNNLFVKMEKIQLVESDNNRYKCQASILGLQTELIKAYYFKNLKNNQNLIMIPYVIKNC